MAMREISVIITDTSPFFSWPDEAIRMILEGKSVKEAREATAATVERQIVAHTDAIAGLQALKASLAELTAPVIPEEATGPVKAGE